MIPALEEVGQNAEFRSMEVEVTPGVRVHAEYEPELYTLRLIGDHSRYEFCAEDELPSTIAILCDLDMNEPIVRRRVLLAVERIISGR
jgi:hypothetical protein